MPGQAPREFMNVEREEIALRRKATGRAFMELEISKCPDRRPENL